MKHKRRNIKVEEQKYSEQTEKYSKTETQMDASRRRKTQEEQNVGFTLAHGINRRHPDREKQRDIRYDAARQTDKHRRQTIRCSQTDRETQETDDKMHPDSREAHK